ncbi:hypothetical protein BU26DRAFT_558930 [Trematosphaeria pertusa]|uniref:Uncharacterized protein n=1 Tax=Trematosphaeria pertusa TaxID=390896 RepID=A0A6A6IX79_9PLEO|nr:uncharacterized protein BU26DRAFT_558930 [Trematosphaeria pertusa]KAF2254220.1 hypothetical protein BU26DRAFT_558930 [Trematosphaeria pertusa]
MSDTPPPSPGSAPENPCPSGPCEPSSPQSARALSPIVRLFNAIASVHQGTYAASPRFVSEKLDAEQYTALHARLAEDKELASWWPDKLRFDWDETSGEFVVRMPGVLHDTIALGLQDAALERVRAAGPYPPHLQTCVDRLHAASTSDTRLPQLGRKAKKSPAVSIRIRDRRSPTFIGEVATSQDTTTLENKAAQYIDDSEGKIKTIACIKVEHWTQDEVAARLARPVEEADEVEEAEPAPAVREAWYCVFRAVKVEQADEITLTVHEHGWTKFRDSQNRTLDGAMNLQLSDFPPTHNLAADSPDNRDLSIDHSELVRILQDAEVEEANSLVPQDRSPSPPDRKRLAFKRKLSDEGLQARVDALAMAGVQKRRA